MTVLASDQPPAPIQRLEPFRRELTQHAARTLGSRFEAEDAAQETIVRAWNALDRFDGRSHLRTWLYRICTNVCIDMLASRQRRALPGLEDTPDHAAAISRASAVTTIEFSGDPADIAVTRESAYLVLEAVMHYLPPKQRAALILRAVLHWRASEIAELLGTSVASVDSALQRARTTLRNARVRRDANRAIELDENTRSRLNRYAHALESSDVSALTALVAHEAT